MDRCLTCPRSPHHSLVAAGKLYCQLCWCPLVRKSRKGYPQSHPCLFCPSCRQQCARKPEPHRALRIRYDGHSVSVRQESRDGPKVNGSGQGQAGYYQRDNSEILLNDSLTRCVDFNKQRDTVTPVIIEEKPIIYRTVMNRREKRTFRRKLHDLETRATRCGFCPRDQPHHETLVSYCCFCGKHLCKNCHLAHGRDTLYKYHPVVDLTSGVNTALQ
ncbi:hypothetical protein LSH36_832g01035 [Paralvinella palmiformis]|uniref:B box-type domain-containing protein n=1 Tax=Paralvinella palmiformis TaxID=53620 RepID=A0AAD9J0U0_9ANNE|nr:hypothetical protein LSH36_832g01035 [Paralvinella palmiformis]